MPKTITYRKKHDSNTWHWCRNCPNWPKRDYAEIKREFRPTSYELCSHCLALEKTGDCKN